VHPKYLERGNWYARSAELMNNPDLDLMRWLRVVGDTIFTLGTVTLAWFMIGLKTGWSLRKKQ